MGPGARGGEGHDAELHHGAAERRPYGGTTVGGPTPKASVADNDLAVGRVVDAVSHSAYWDDTAVFILEDDAQNGADMWTRTGAWHWW